MEHGQDLPLCPEGHSDVNRYGFYQNAPREQRFHCFTCKGENRPGFFVVRDGKSVRR